MPAKKNPANSDAAPPSECSFADELIHYLKDESVGAALGTIFENKLAELLTAMAEIKQKSAKIKQANANLKVEKKQCQAELAAGAFENRPLGGARQKVKPNHQRSDCSDVRQSLLLLRTARIRRTSLAARYRKGGVGTLPKKTGGDDL